MKEEFTDRNRKFKSIATEISITGISYVLLFIVIYTILKDYLGKHRMMILLPIVFISSTIVTILKEYSLIGKIICSDTKSNNTGFKFLNIFILAFALNLFLFFFYIGPFNKSLKLFLFNFIIIFIFTILQEYSGYNKYICSPRNQEYGTHRVKK